jgi:hypothetical protein
MKNKITEKIDKIEFIIRYALTGLMIILGFISLIIKNDILYTIAIVLGTYAIANMMILEYIKTKIRDIFFEEELNNLKKEGKQK